MHLSPGSRLGPYEITGTLGSGAMGEVYRARDPRLGREVAIKILPAAFSNDPDRLQRFEREARAAAALTHPNILAVFDIGSEQQRPYIVSELLDGDTLRGKLDAAGGLSVRRGVEYAIQLAHGLAAAHEKGIVHRDLKPENVFVTVDGRLKILDFGLAKLIEPASAFGSGHTATATPETTPGVVLGTLGYMSPEQLRGQQADHRSDIFSLGAILYEMVSGRRAFQGASSADTISAILDKDPLDLPIAERQIPPALARLVDRCLEKQPSARFQSTGDLAFALEALSTQSGATVLVDTAIKPNRDRRVAATRSIVGILAAILLAVGAWAMRDWLTARSVDPRVLRFAVAAPDGWTLPSDRVGQVGTGPVSGLTPLALSPDGRQLAFIARNGDGIDHLWIRSLDSLEARMLQGTAGASVPFWSSDSRFVAFFADRRLKKVDLTGSQPFAICDAGNGTGGTWNRDGVILFAATASQGIAAPIMRVSASGGVPTPATKPVAGDTNHTRPFFLPGGRRFLYSLAGGPVKVVFLASLDSAERTKVLEADAGNVQYAQGHLLYLRGATLFAQRFDPDRVGASEPIPIADAVQTQSIGNVASAVFTVSESGLLAYRRGANRQAPGGLVWFDRAGKRLAAVGERADFGDVELSPDGRRALVSIMSPAGAPGSSGSSFNADVWAIDLARGVGTRLTDHPANDGLAIWVAKGDRVLFRSNRDGADAFYERRLDGVGGDQLVLGNVGNVSPMSWSPDGHVLYRSGNTLFSMPMAGDRKPSAYLSVPQLAPPARLSPDGKWVAYVSGETGRNEVYVTSYPTPGVKTRVSAAGGMQPRWRGDSRELFYLSAESTGALQVHAVPFSVTDTGPEVGTATFLFRVSVGGLRSAYDVTADGQRFLVNSVEDSAPAIDYPITVVVNWAAALRK